MARAAARVAAFALLAALASPAAQAAQPAPAPDDTDLLFRLGMMQGHLIIGRELLQAGQTELALPHFGHPVQELYGDIADALAAHQVPPFDAALVRLEAAVAQAPRATATAALQREVDAAIARARAATPAGLRDSIPAMISICSDVVDAAAGEYGEALNRGRIDSPVEYHDSRGYLTWADQESQALAAKATGAEAGLLARFRAVLAKAQWIVAPLLPPEPPRATVTDYRSLAAEAVALTPR
jgi:hypothetical protein